MLSKIGQIAVNARDIDRATAFYRDKLGMTLLFSAPPGLAFFDAGGTWLMLGLPSAPEFDHPSSILYFDVPDIQATYRDLKAKGVEFRSEPHMLTRQGGKELWLSDFRDSEGNTHALRSWK
jgi:catechol 2,3-dioxygenase-like lactoylglutathione lyase family enzyme